MYDFNSLKALPNGVKQVDTYHKHLKAGLVVYISCPRWRTTGAGLAEWHMIPPNSKFEVLAYKLCSKN